MNKLVTTIFATTAAAVGLFFAGSINADAATSYTVKSGDSVWAISQKFDTTINAIEKANHISNHLILPGQRLTVPTAQEAANTTTTTTQSTQPATTSQATTNQTSQQSQSTNTTSAATTGSTTTSTGTSSSYTGSNMKSYVLSQMQSRTGVSASTWNAIIQRESNWQPSVRNSSSGAYGLFQNMHISGGSVEAQVNAAVSLYKAQGMSAWAL